MLCWLVGASVKVAGKIFWKAMGCGAVWRRCLLSDPDPPLKESFDFKMPSVFLGARSLRLGDRTVSSGVGGNCHGARR